MFARVGWSDGAHESFAYTEVDNTFALGADFRGTPWHRDGWTSSGSPRCSNGLADDHRTPRTSRSAARASCSATARLRYGRETPSRAYYTAHLWRGLFGSVDGQFIAHPGYNKDRGPVFVGSFRLHIDF